MNVGGTWGLKREQGNKSLKNTDIYKSDPELIKKKKKRPFISFWPVMFVLLSSSQQLLDILGDLFGFADDVLCAGKRGVRVHLQIIKFRDRATLSQPATAPQPPSPAEPAKWVKKQQQIKPPAKTCFLLLNCTWTPLCLTDFWVIFLPRVIQLRVIERVVIVTFWHAALLLQFWSLGGKKNNMRERSSITDRKTQQQLWWKCIFFI